jgi:hypothetical protein
LDWKKGLPFVTQLAMCAVALVGLGISVIAQSARPVAFDVASVKPNRSGAVSMSISQLVGNTFAAENAPLRELIR